MLLSSAPIFYLITSGNLTAATRPADPPFAQLLQLVRRAVDAGVSLIQLREKQLSEAVLFELAQQAAAPRVNRAVGAQVSRPYHTDSRSIVVVRAPPARMAATPQPSPASNDIDHAGRAASRRATGCLLPHWGQISEACANDSGS